MATNWKFAVGKARSLPVRRLALRQRIFAAIYSPLPPRERVGGGLVTEIERHRKNPLPFVKRGEASRLTSRAEKIPSLLNKGV